MKKLFVSMAVVFLSHFLVAGELTEKKPIEIIEYSAVREGTGPDGLIERNAASALKKPIKIIVLGQVAKPGIYYIEEGMNASSVVNIAGGYVRMAYVSEFLITNPSLKERWYFRNYEGSGKPPNALSRWIIRPGDIIYISEIMK